MDHSKIDGKVVLTRLAVSIGFELERTEIRDHRFDLDFKLLLLAGNPDVFKACRGSGGSLRIGNREPH